MTDITIVGAGIAGSACATILAQNHVAVRLIAPLENKPFKVGESLPGAALPLIRRLGIKQLNELLSQQEYFNCTGNLSAWGSEHWTQKDSIQNPQGGGWHINRLSLENALRNLAIKNGVEWYSSTVREIQHTRAGWFVNTDADKSHECQCLVDATGRKNVVCKKLASLYKHDVAGSTLNRQQIHEQFACVAWVAADNDKEHCTRVKSVEDGWWYTALIPGNHQIPANHPVRVIGKFCDARSAKQLQKQPQQFFAEFRNSGVFPRRVTETLLQPLKVVEAGVSRLPQAWFLDDENSSEEKACIAVGDAALSLDPMSSQGMFFALYSGIKCAELLLNRLSGKLTFSTGLTSYQESIDQIFISNEKTRALMRISENRFNHQAFWKIKAPQTQIKYK